MSCKYHNIVAQSITKLHVEYKVESLLTSSDGISGNRIFLRITEFRNYSMRIQFFMFLRYLNHNQINNIENHTDILNFNTIFKKNIYFFLITIYIIT